MKRITFIFIALSVNCLVGCFLDEPLTMFLLGRLLDGVDFHPLSKYLLVLVPMAIAFPIVIGDLVFEVCVALKNSLGAGGAARLKRFANKFLDCIVVACIAMLAVWAAFPPFARIGAFEKRNCDFERKVPECASAVGSNRECPNANSGGSAGKCLMCRSAEVCIPRLRLIGTETLDQAVGRILGNVEIQGIGVVFDAELSGGKVNAFDAENITLLEALRCLCGVNGLALLTDGADTFHIVERGKFMRGCPSGSQTSEDR